jgi:NADH-quinone oxidoreductase subunit J
MSEWLLAQNPNQNQNLRLADWLLSPISWGLAIAAIGLWLMLTPSRRGRFLGRVMGAVGLVVIAIALPSLNSLGTLSQWGEQIVFWLMAGVAVGCSAAAISVNNPVYTAIWFAGSLLGVAGLFMFQHAQFLAGATIVVYAGAIVVTFLFVLMLANPEGQARYDRISWSRFSIPLGVMAATGLLAVIAFSFGQPSPGKDDGNLQAPDHMVQVGTELFAKHLVEVEVAGSLLLIALVGAIAIVIHAKESPVAHQEDPRGTMGGAER